MRIFLILFSHQTQSAVAVDYTGCIYAKEYNFPNKCPGNDTKQSDGEDSVMLELCEMLHCHRSLVHFGPE